MNDNDSTEPGRATIVVVKRGAISSQLLEESVILDVTNGRYYGLDSVGTQIWNLIQEPRTAIEISTILVDEYEVSPDRCEQDVLAFLADLASHDLIEKPN